MDKRKVASFVGVIGVIMGIVIMITGFAVMNPDTYTLGKRDSLGSLIEFGGDYQTEMYHMTYQVGHQVQQSYVNVCNAIGWLIVALGASDICYFCVKMVESMVSCNQAVADEKSDSPVKNEVDTLITTTYETTFTKPVASAVGKWTCANCGTENSVSYGQCKKCGQYRG